MQFHRYHFENFPDWKCVILIGPQFLHRGPFHEKSAIGSNSGLAAGLGQIHLSPPKYKHVKIDYNYSNFNVNEIPKLNIISSLMYKYISDPTLA